MKPFEYFNITSLDEANSILAGYYGKAKALAGGTDLLGTIKDEIHKDSPDVLVNIKKISGLRYIREESETLKIGALTTLYEIETDQIIKDRYKLLAEAAHSVATPQIRNMGTIGGNICQEPRCWYYRNPDNNFFCMRKGGKRCNALTGENRYHSIYGACRIEKTPCSLNCPSSINIQDYLCKVRENDLESAAKVLLQNNPMPSITGRVCPHFCEDECNRGEFDEAVSIREIERYVGDYILDNANEIISPPGNDSGKSVAIIGSGPAGLSAAFYLRLYGHKVVVFEKMEMPGGMLRYGIPAYRLPRELVSRQINVLEGTGIEFRTDVHIGEDISLKEIKKRFDAILIATGAWGQPSIGLDGEDLTLSGLEFLKNIIDEKKNIEDKIFVVIGGGNVAVDVAMTAKRLGAKKVTMICLESRNEMPAFEWEIRQAVEEGVELMNSWGPLKVFEKGGKVKGVEIVRCKSVFDANGNFSPTFDESRCDRLAAEKVILAVGQRTDLSFVDQNWGLKVDRGLIKVGQDMYETNIEGVFSGGDVTSGPATITHALAAGKKAALGIEKYFGENSSESASTKQNEPKSFLSFNNEYLVKTARCDIPLQPIQARRIDIEDSIGLDDSAAEREASRCFNCGCVAVNAADMAPVLIALDAKIWTNKRVVTAETFFSIGLKSSTILDQDEIVTEIEIPAQTNLFKSYYKKFRIRNSIDFPIVSVASCLDIRSKIINKVRIVIGAVAPVPLRVKNAEEFLTGKVLDSEIADKAAELAVKDVIPLKKNGFKVQIVRALIKRTLIEAI